MARAGKAFVLSFSEAISAESAGAGVHVLGVLPRAYRRASSRLGSHLTCWIEYGQRWEFGESIAGPSLDALADGSSMFVPGLMNRLSLYARRLLPRAVVTMATQKALE